MLRGCWSFSSRRPHRLGESLPFHHLADEPTITADDFRQFLEAARRYETLAVTSLLCSHLFHPTVLGQNPFGCVEAARVAARRTLDMPIYPEYTDYACVSGLAVYNLTEYMRKWRISASNVVVVRDSDDVPVRR